MSNQSPPASSSHEIFSNEINLRQLELTITRKLDGLLHGEHRSPMHGPGIELSEGRPYQPGDDARRIDWNLSARMNDVFVRETVAERELETWLVIDASSSLDFGTAQREKRDLALIAAGAFGLLGARGGNRIGAFIFDGKDTAILPPRSGRKSVMQLLRRIESHPRDVGEVGSLAEALQSVRITARRRGRIVVISDLIDQGPWPSALRGLAVRHDVVVAQISDPRDWELPATGLLTLVDPETGRLLEVQSSDAKLRKRFELAAGKRRAELDHNVRSSGARHLQLSTDRDWMPDLVHFVLSSRWVAS